MSETADQKAFSAALHRFVLDMLTTSPAAADVLRHVLERQIFGQHSDSYDVDKLAWLAAGISSSDYAQTRMAGTPRFADTGALLSFALSQITISGLYLEFGVFQGNTISHIARMRPAERIYGFDSFEGLPEKWRDGFEAGAFALNGLPHVPDNVELIKGWFDATLPGFCAAHAGHPAAFIHVDCDLYSSTRTVFNALRPHIRPGTIIVFDEYYNYPGWQLHEYRALQEFCAESGLSYRYIGLVPHHQQVAICVMEKAAAYL